MTKGLKKWRLFTLLAALTVFLSACGEEHLSTLRPAGEVGRVQFNLLMLASSIMLLVIVVVVIVYAIVLARFRRSKMGEDYVPKQVAGNHKLEIIWTTIPIILLIILAVPVVYYTYVFEDNSGMAKENDKNPNAPLTVNVVAKQYWWEFEYPQLGVVTAQELVVPTKETVYFNLKGADIKHSFWIPAVGGKKDTNVENVNKFHLEFDKESKGLKEGVFYGKCTEFCGPSHALMDFKVKALSRPEFDGWVKRALNAKKPIASTVAAQEGEKIFAKACVSCHAISPKGTGGSVGPNLATFGERTRVAGYLEHNKDNIKRWINDPQAVKPTTLMPQPETLNNGKKYSEEQLDQLAEYLMGLKIEQSSK